MSHNDLPDQTDPRDRVADEALVEAFMGSYYIPLTSEAEPGTPARHKDEVAEDDDTEHMPRLDFVLRLSGHVTVTETKDNFWYDAGQPAADTHDGGAHGPLAAPAAAPPADERPEPSTPGQVRRETRERKAWPHKWKIFRPRALRKSKRAAEDGMTAPVASTGAGWQEMIADVRAALAQLRQTTGTDIVTTTALSEEVARGVIEVALRHAEGIVADAHTEAERARKDLAGEITALADRRDALNAQLTNVHEMLATLTGAAVATAAAGREDGAGDYIEHTTILPKQKQASREGGAYSARERSR
ncbi:hypothetical protein [Streptomyces phaeochromogenes]|uniref:hypothetical protein n=1 Tax=Streptomyces phaeochromogenes TaxID=1923 RepID=UPI003715B0BE